MHKSVFLLISLIFSIGIVHSEEVTPVKKPPGDRLLMCSCVGNVQGGYYSCMRVESWICSDTLGKGREKMYTFKFLQSYYDLVNFETVGVGTNNGNFVILTVFKKFGSN